MKRFTFAALAAGLLCAACVESTAPPAFAISATVDRATITPGDSVNFVVQASGQNLLRLNVAFGDATTFERDLFGAQTVTANLRHTYPAAGQFTMTAVITAVSGETRQTTVGVQVR
jgi:hypothetical protein